MSDINLNLSRRAEHTMSELKNYFGTESDAAIIRKALALLKVAVDINQTDGELIARRGHQEARIRL